MSYNIKKLIEVLRSAADINNTDYDHSRKNLTELKTAVAVGEVEADFYPMVLDKCRTIIYNSFSKDQPFSAKLSFNQVCTASRNLGEKAVDIINMVSIRGYTSGAEEALQSAISDVSKQKIDSLDVHHLHTLTDGLTGMFNRNLKEYTDAKGTKLVESLCTLQLGRNEDVIYAVRDLKFKTLKAVVELNGKLK